MAVPPRSTPATTGTLLLLYSLKIARPRLAEFWRAFPENDDFEIFRGRMERFIEQLQVMHLVRCLGL
jgi:hypothetical protein